MKAQALHLAAVLLMPSAADAFFGAKEPKPPKPHRVEGFDWKNPFSSEALSSFEPSCETTVTFPAMEYTLHNLVDPQPLGLKPWSGALKKFFKDREYPGSWAGIDRHLHDRSILLMNYADIPLTVRLWIEDEERTGGENKGVFAVLDKATGDDDRFDSVVEFPAADQVDRSKDGDRVAIFAPGVLYHTLPMWAAESSTCKDELLDMSRYHSEPKDNGIVGWIDHKKPNERVIEFRVKVQALKAKAPPVEPASKTETREEL